MGLLESLRQYENTFQRADVSPSSGGRKKFEELPDGEYKVKIDSAYLNENKYNGNPQVTWKFIVLGGNYDGRFVFKNSQLDNEDRVVWFKQDMFRCGVQVDSVEKIEQCLESVLDRCLMINLKSKEARNGKVYQNVYIQKEVPVPSSSSFDMPF